MGRLVGGWVGGLVVGLQGWWGFTVVCLFGSLIGCLVCGLVG